MQQLQILGISGDRYNTNDGLKTPIGNAQHLIGSWVWCDGEFLLGGQQYSSYVPYVPSGKSGVLLYLVVAGKHDPYDPYVSTNNSHAEFLAMVNPQAKKMKMKQVKDRDNALLYLPWENGQYFMSKIGDSSFLSTPPADSKGIEIVCNNILINNKTGDIYKTIDGTLFKNDVGIYTAQSSLQAPSPINIDPIYTSAGVKNICCGNPATNTTTYGQYPFFSDGCVWDRVFDYSVGNIVIGEGYDLGDNFIYKAIAESRGKSPGINPQCWSKIGVVSVIDLYSLVGELHVIANNNSVPSNNLETNIDGIGSDCFNNYTMYIKTGRVSEYANRFGTPIVFNFKNNQENVERLASFQHFFDDGTYIVEETATNSKIYNGLEIIIGNTTIDTSKVDAFATGFGQNLQIATEKRTSNIKGNRTFVGKTKTYNYDQETDNKTQFTYTATYYDISSALDKSDPLPYYLCVWQKGFWETQESGTCLDGSWINQYFYSDANELYSSSGELLLTDISKFNCRAIWHDDKNILLVSNGEIILYNRGDKSNTVLYATEGYLGIGNTSTINSKNWNFEKKVRELNEEIT